ncbi:MAG: hypothetical protein ACXAEN_17450, partial [Candidatus Thorarchaeota archaeon]
MPNRPVLISKQEGAVETINAGNPSYDITNIQGYDQCLMVALVCTNHANALDWPIASIQFDGNDLEVGFTGGLIDHRITMCWIKNPPQVIGDLVVTFDRAGDGQVDDAWGAVIQLGHVDMPAFEGDEVGQTMINSDHPYWYINTFVRFPMCLLASVCFLDGTTHTKDSQSNLIATKALNTRQFSWFWQVFPRIRNGSVREALNKIGYLCTDVTHHGGTLMLIPSKHPGVRGGYHHAANQG